MRIFTLALGLLAANFAVAQYQYFQIQNGTPFGTYTPPAVPATQAGFIFGPPAGGGNYLHNDTVSGAIALPFSWDFGGTPVNSVYVSDNGYITFSPTANSVATPAAAVGAAEPNNAIYGWWSDLVIRNAITSGAPDNGTADDVSYGTFGASPSRSFVVQWWSATAQNVGAPVNASWVYVAIILYEQGGFDILHWNSSNAQTSVGTATIGWENAAGTNGQIFANQAYPTPTGENFHIFRFEPGTTQAFNLKHFSFEVPNQPISGNSYLASGQVYNLGSTPITSFQVNVGINGGTPFTQTITPPGGLAQGEGAEYNLTLPALTADGTLLNYTAYTNNLNGTNMDMDTSDDTVSTQSIASTGQGVTRGVLVEEFTSAYCQFCPDGHVVLDQVENSSPNLVVVQHHAWGFTQQDQMYQPWHGTYYQAFGAGAPSAAFDRIRFNGEDDVATSRSTWQTYANQRLAVPAPASVTVDNDYNETTRLLTSDVSVRFSDYVVSGDYRITAWIVADTVIGPGGNGWDQVNFYNTEFGHPFFGAGDPIPNYPHTNVSTTLLSGDAWGDTGIIPAQPVLGTDYTTQFTYTLPAGENPDNYNIMVLVNKFSADANAHSVLNSTEAAFKSGSATARAETPQLVGSVYPNPTESHTLVSVNLPAGPQDVTLQVVNNLGQVVNEHAVVGSLQRTFALDVSDLPAGMYTVKVAAQAGTFLRKLVVR